MHNHRAKRLIGFILLGFILFLIGNRVDDLRLYQGASVAMYVIGIASIVLLTGFSGQISLGNGAIMALGGFSATLAQSTWGLPLPLTFVVAVLGAALFGLILGVAAARLSGPYLAGATLALAVALPSLANQFSFLGGEQGLQFNSGSAPEFFNGEVSQYKWFFWISALAALLITWLISNILQSRYGRGWRAVRSNSTAAELVGIHSARSKVLAFTLASGIAGLAGAVLALNLGGVSPSAYPLSLSFALITGAVLAGISTLSGSVIGALLLVGMSELVGSLTSRFSLEDVLAENLKELLVSVLLILAVVFTPNGPGDRIRERKELHKKKK